MARLTAEFRTGLRSGAGQPEAVLRGIRDRMKAPLGGKSGRSVASVIRTGPGSLEEQINRRTFIDESGTGHPWVEPRYVRGSLPEPALARERILWDAALGRSGAAITRIEPNRVAISVDERQVGQSAAGLGNRIVSSVPYFNFVTGGFNARRSSALAQPVKPSRSMRTFPQAKFAMWWFLGLTYGLWLSDAALKRGIPTPPKNLGITPVVRKRALDNVLRYIGTGQPEGTSEKDQAARLVAAVLRAGGSAAKAQATAAKFRRNRR